MLILQERQICPYSNKCQYNKNDSCQGSSPQRATVFTCEYVTNGNIMEKGEHRNSLDQTGQMKILME